VQDACFTRDIKASPVGQVSMEEIKRVHLASLYRIGVELWTMDEICLALA
jgi:ABC-type transport system involved in cytochrome c biogenesis ATPase subunit